MTTHSAPDSAKASQSGCWCCGADKTETELVRLGGHPEVGICTRCARWLHRRATQLEDAHRPGVAAHARGLVRGARSAVVQRGWHRRGPLGALLRGIDRYLP